MPALLRSCTHALLVLMLVVTSASAWLRLSAPREPCIDWPACRLQAEPATMTFAQAPSDTERAVRTLHRVAASAVLLGTIALLLALRGKSAPRGVRGAAAGLLALALALSALGVATGGSRAGSAATASMVMLGNLVGGLAMVAAAARLWACARRPVHATCGGARPPPMLLAPALVLWLAQAALGALSGAGALRIAPQGHLLLALAVLTCTVLLARHALLARHRRTAAALLALAVLQPLAGGVAAMLDAPVASVLLHNLGAALGVATLAAWPVDAEAG
ncbi:MAG: hypothetical protein JNN18_19770 [Rubrivivax sp.]|nr:hypothetical protein [Rubrivivax sp.]